MDIFKYADVSTKHITAKDNDILDRLKRSDNFPMTVANYEYGYFIALPELETFRKYGEKDRLIEHGMSEAFCHLIEMAIKKKCTILRLDRDGWDCKGLKEFEW